MNLPSQEDITLAFAIGGGVYTLANLIARRTKTKKDDEALAKIKGIGGKLKMIIKLLLLSSRTK